MCLYHREAKQWNKVLDITYHLLSSSLSPLHCLRDHSLGFMSSTYIFHLLLHPYFLGDHKGKKNHVENSVVFYCFFFGPWGKDFKNLQTPSWTALLLGANWEHKDFIPRRLFLSSSYCRFRYIKKSFPPIISSCGWNILKKVLASFSFSSVNVLIKSRDFCMVKTN